MKALYISLFLLLLNSSKTMSQVWNRHAIDSTLRGADGVKLMDINNDGLPDVATGWEESGVTKIYLHPQKEKVKDEWPSVVVGKTPCVEDALFCDVNGDGLYDVISCTEGWDKNIYFHISPNDISEIMDSTKWSTMILPPSKKLTQWMYAQTMQIDGKGGLDIVAGSKNKNGVIGWFESPIESKNITEWKWHPLCDASWIMSIILRDMNGDGYIDIAYSDRMPGDNQGIHWLENPGCKDVLNKKWKNHFIACRNKQVMFMDIKDLDQDGLDDIILTEKTDNKIVFLKRLDKSGLNWESHSIDLPPNAGTPKSVSIGDINLDGKNDIVYSAEKAFDNKEGVFWLSYNKSPYETKWISHSISGPIGIKYDKVELLDIDNDDDLDILTTEERYGENEKGLGVIWYENPTK